jgi:hypothetical protein
MSMAVKKGASLAGRDHLYGYAMVLVLVALRQPRPSSRGRRCLMIFEVRACVNENLHQDLLGLVESGDYPLS